MSTMRAIAFIVACMACLGQARRVQVAKPMREDVHKPLALFLRALNPESGFHASNALPKVGVTAPSRSSAPSMKQGRFKSPKSKFTFQEKLKLRENNKWESSYFPVGEIPEVGKKGYIFFQNSLPGIAIQPEMPSFFSGSLPNPKNKRFFPLLPFFWAIFLGSSLYLYLFVNGVVDAPDGNPENAGAWFGGLYDPFVGGEETILEIPKQRR